jgi:very-short-patch-repair endonuclease
MLDTRRPFTRADAVAAGISPRRLGGSRFRRIFRGVFISAEAPATSDERVVAALMLHPDGAWASHVTGARWCGVAVPDSSTTHVSVTAAKDRRWQPGLKPHVAPRGTKTRTWRGVRVSDPIRMFIELASMLDLVDLVVAGDNMLRVFGLTAEQLVAGLEESRDYWSPAARHAAQFVRDDVDSPMETRLRMLIVLAGLPEPEVNVKLRDRDGNVVVRFDLGYPHLRLAIEYDGRQHVEIIENWESDIDRGDLVDAARWRIVKVIARGIYVEPGRTLERVRRALEDRGVRLPEQSDEWRKHFPGRRTAA